MKVTFYYDVVCPFAYLASTEIEKVCAGHELVWQPILLGGLLKAIGNPEPMKSAPPAKAFMNLLDAQRWAEYRGVPLTFPPGHPRRTVDAMRLCTARPALTHALFRAYWVEGADVSNPDTLSRIAGEDAAPLITTSRDQLRVATEAAVTQGIFGVPSMLVETTPSTRYLFWGQDRLDFVVRVLAGWQPQAG
jgi:2-hydroxychromene-2-carboxylate isomerase